MKKMPKWADIALIPFINLVLALLVSGLVVALIGEDPFEAMSIMVKGAVGSTYGWGYTLYYATNFIFTGLAVAVAFHARLFKIGDANRTLGYRVTMTTADGKRLKKRLNKIGIFRKSGHEHLSGSVVFPIMDLNGNPVQMYGRKITFGLRKGTPDHLYLEQPMAGDLRLIVGIMRISNELERIADQAVNISERTIFLCQHPPRESIPAMDQPIDVGGQMRKQANSWLRALRTDQAG